MTPARRDGDADARLVRSAARRVAATITIAVSALVLAVLVAALAIVFSQVPPGLLLSPGSHETTIDLGGQDILLWGLVVGAIAIALAGTIALLVTRRAVAPLVEALRRQRRFVADASHELRTPLAILDARLQVLERSLAPGDPHTGLVGELRGDSKNLIAVVGDLLDAVDVAPTGVVVPAAVGGTAASAAASMRMLAADRGVEIAVRRDADGLAAVPETSLHRSLVALLDNAVKHSPDGGVVVVRVADARAGIAVSVTDAGAGIRGISPDRVFDRFARSSEAVDGGGSARTGFGIGLALVQDTVTRYGGAVEVTDTSERGTTITLTLPRA